jgi:transposase-like protein
MPEMPADSHTDMFCPHCQSDDAVLHRSARSAAVYFCRDCEHEWEVERTGTASPRTPERHNHITRSSYEPCFDDLPVPDPMLG